MVGEGQQRDLKVWCPFPAMAKAMPARLLAVFSCLGTSLSEASPSVANTQSRQKNSDAVFQRRRNKNLWTWLPRGLQIVLESRIRLGSLGSHSAWLLSEGFSAVAFSMAVFHSPQPVYPGHLEVCKKERPLSSPFIRWCLWCRCTCGHFRGVFSVGSSVLCFVANTVKQLYLGYVCEREKIAKLVQCPWRRTAVYWSSLCVLYWTSNGVHIIIHACPFAFYMSPDLIFTVGLVPHLLVLSVKTLHLREVMGAPSQLGDSHWSWIKNLPLVYGLLGPSPLSIKQKPGCAVHGCKMLS